MNKLFVGTIAAGLLAALGVSAGKPKVDILKLPPPASASGVTYTGNIKGILDNSCVPCHGPEKAKARLRLDSIEAALKGGENGKSILPGKSAESMLVHNVSYLGDEDHFMPPPKNKAKIKQLTPEEIGLIRAWIDQGAK
jgi:hypothetical protein